MAAGAWGAVTVRRTVGEVTAGPDGGEPDAVAVSVTPPLSISA
jgi:hypothetical protein